jgi:hypothetical protein
MMKNSIIAHNTDNTGTGQGCFGTLYSDDYNKLQNMTGCALSGDTVNNVTIQDGKVSSNLSDNGGLTKTYQLKTGSNAIDAGNSIGCTDYDGIILTADQRGFARENECDIGAFEYISEKCTDSKDNDLDLMVDCDDSDCAGDPACATLPTVVPEDLPTVVPEDCDNGLDDDGDGSVDCNDPDCASDPACVTPNTGIITNTVDKIDTSNSDSTTEGISASGRISGGAGCSLNTSQ